MLRIFGHYIALPALLLAFLETVIFFGLLYFLAHMPVGLGLTLPSEDTSTQIPAILSGVSFLALVAVGMYNRSVFFRTRSSVKRGMIAAPLVFIAQSVFLFVYGGVMQIDTDPYYAVVMVTVAAFFPLTWIIRSVFINAVNLDVFRRRVLVFGYGPLARNIDGLRQHQHKGHFTVVGYVRFGEEADSTPLHPVLSNDLLDRRHALAGYVREHQVDEIVVAARERRRPAGKLGQGLPVWDLLECKFGGTRVSTYASFFEREAARIDLDELQPGWLIFSDGFRINWFLRFVERSFDVVVSGGFLLFTLPIFLFTALAIKANSRGPVFYKQERVGMDGRPFRLMKFRSMRQDAEKDGVPRWATTNDDRITAVGQFIRKTRIDEMPQVINVLKGEMSFVGPRPERPFFVEALRKKIPYYDERHRVKPGITGWAQTNYPYGASEEDAKMKLSYDLYYVKNGSLFLDILILLQTVRVVLMSDGAR